MSNIKVSGLNIPRKHKARIAPVVQDNKKGLYKPYIRVTDNGFIVKSKTDGLLVKVPADARKTILSAIHDSLLGGYDIPSVPSFSQPGSPESIHETLSNSKLKNIYNDIWIGTKNGIFYFYWVFDTDVKRLDIAVSDIDADQLLADINSL